MDPNIVGALVKDGSLALLLFVNMIYLGRKIDRLTEAVYKGKKKRRVAR